MLVPAFAATGVQKKMCTLINLVSERMREMKKVDTFEKKGEALQDRVAMLSGAAGNVNENLDLNSVLQGVVDSARELTEARYGVVSILRDMPRDFRVNWTPVGEHFPTWIDLSGNAFPKTSFYTITGLDQDVRYKVRVCARFDGYSSSWSDPVEAVATPKAHSAEAKNTEGSTAPPTDTMHLRAVGAVRVVCNQPGELSVSWAAPVDSGQPHDLITSGMSATDHQRLEEAAGRQQSLAFLSILLEPLRISDMGCHNGVKDFSESFPLPLGSLLAVPIRHQEVGVGSICLAKEPEGQEFSRQDEKILAHFAPLAAAVIVSTRRYQEEQQARDHLKTVIDTSPVGVAVFSAITGEPRSLNREAKRIVQALDQSNRPLRKVLESLTVRWPGGKEMPLVEFVFSQCQNGGKVQTVEELVLSVPEGRSSSVLANASPVRMSDGKAISLVVTMQDMKPLEELNKLRVGFLAMVSHELRAPLTSIKGSAVTLQESLDTLDPAETAQFARLIEMQADRMRDLISELLDIARIESGSLSVAPEPTDVIVLIDEARSTFLSGEERDTLSIELATNLPWVMADRRRVVQVLDNLLTNAAKYSHEPSEIRVSASLDGGHVAISVADQGRGVPTERIPNLFRKFARIEGDQGEMEVAGSGLGLAICKGIVEAHGGRIWAESAGLGLGTQFTFTLPVVDGQVSDATENLLLRAKSTGTSENGSVRILVVDDDPHSLRYVRNVLSNADYIPIVTGNPKEALELVEADQPHLILLDLMLPGSDGIELMKRILAISEVPVIFLSAYGRDETIAIALESGAADYIVKPFSQTELVARVRAALRRQLVQVQQEPRESFVLGDLVVDYAERMVSIAGRPISLTFTEYRLLYALSTSAGQVLTYSELLQKVWNLEPSSDRSVIRTNIGRLRRKLGDDANNPKYLFAEPRVGYRMPKA